MKFFACLLLLVLCISAAAVGAFELKLKNKAFPTDIEIHVAFSGGGIRATIGTLVAAKVFPYIQHPSVKLYGASGGAWGVAAITKALNGNRDVDFDDVYNRVFKPANLQTDGYSDTLWGPDLNAIGRNSYYTQWKTNIGTEIIQKFGLTNKNARDLPANVFFAVTNTDAKFDTYKGHCFFNHASVNCLNVLSESGLPVAFSGSVDTDLQTILTHSSSAYACGWVSTAERWNFRSKNDPFMMGTKEFYFTDGGCGLNIPILFPVYVNSGNRRIVISFDFSDNRDPIQELKILRNKIDEYIFNHDSRTAIAALLDQLIMKSLSHTWQYAVSGNTLYVNIPLFGRRSGFEILKRFPTMNVATPKRWTDFEMASFIHEWRGYLNDIKVEFEAVLNLFATTGHV